MPPACVWVLRSDWWHLGPLSLLAYVTTNMHCPCRHQSTARILAHLLPWLTSSGYRVITLSEAQTLSNGVGPLTAEALELHNQMFASEDSRSSLVDGDVLRGLLGPAASVAASTKGHTAPPSPVKGSQVSCCRVAWGKCSVSYQKCLRVAAAAGWETEQCGTQSSNRCSVAHSMPT